MAGYDATMLQGLQRLQAQEMGRRRLAQAQRQQLIQQMLGMQRLGLQERGAVARMEGENFRNRLALDQFGNTVRHQLEIERQNRENAARAERAAAQRDLAQRRGNLKPGFRWKGEDSAEQELIPGGPEFLKMKGAHAADLTELATAQQQAQNVVKTIDFLLGVDPKTGKEPKTLPEGLQSNFGGYNTYLTRLIPGPTQDWRVKLEQLQDQLKAIGAGAVRHSGGAIGAITEKEWPIMANQIAAVNPMMEEPSAAASLRDIRNQAMALRQNAVRKYNEAYSGTPFHQRNVHRLPSEPPPGVDPRVWEKVPLEKRLLWAE